MIAICVNLREAKNFKNLFQRLIVVVNKLVDVFHSSALRRSEFLNINVDPIEISKVEAEKQVGWDATILGRTNDKNLLRLIKHR